MYGEYAKAEYYDAAADQPFRDAVLDKLVAPAYMRAIGVCGETDTTVVGEEIHYEDCRATYDFYAQTGDDTIIITSCIFGAVGELTNEAVRVLGDEIRSSNLSETMRERYGQDEIAIRNDAVVELFTRRSFAVRLTDGDIVVRTDLGIAIDGCEIDTAGERQPLAELDVQREKIFESEELVELVRALYGMELIDQPAVKDFLDAF
jgi:hypothetical protein